MNLTDNERIQLAQNKLNGLDGYINLPEETRKTLIEIFRLGMVEMELLDTRERILELTIEQNNIFAK